MIYLNTVKNYYISLQQYLCSVVNKDDPIQTLPRIWRRGQSSFWGHKLLLITFFAVISFVFIIWSIFFGINLQSQEKKLNHTLHVDPVNTVICSVKKIVFNKHLFFPPFPCSFLLWKRKKDYPNSHLIVTLSHSLCIVTSTKAGLLLPGKTFLVSSLFSRQFGWLK